MNEVNIIDAGDNRYLSEFMEDLPNGMLNKVITGCGATSVALSNDVKYIIAMPYTSLIQNKKQWADDNNILIFDLCSVCVNTREEVYDILYFEGNKIVTTYDALSYVTGALKLRDDFDKWKLMVDESHQLVKSAGLRWNAVSNVIEFYNQYKRYVFVTATPIQDKYQIKQLKTIPKVKIKWNNLTDVDVEYTPYKGNLNVGIASLVQRHISNELEGNAHIFINSVTAIVSVIKALKKVDGINRDNINVVCSRSNEKNEVKLMRVGYPISDVGVNVKKVNFYTSTAFEGCDIEDEDGITYIISDGYVDYTKIDITTILPQIIGRIRNSKRKNKVELIYTNNKYLNVSEEEFKIDLDERIAAAHTTVDYYNDMVKKGHIKQAETHKKSYMNDMCVVENKDGDLIVNEGIRYSEMSNFQTMQQTYVVSNFGLDNTIQDGSIINNGTKYNYKRTEKIYPTEINKSRIGVGVNYNKLCKEYYDGMTSNDMTIIDQTNKAFIGYPSIGKYWGMIGAEGFKACSFEIKNIRLRINANDSNKIKALTKYLNLEVGERYTSNDLKAMIKKAYDKSKLITKAKATDIYKVYNAKPTKITVDGKRVRGFEVLSAKTNNTIQRNI